MAKKDRKELVIIGAGPGGYAAAFHAADLGIKVTLIDPEVNPGGVCLYRGCIPSKALLHLAKTKEEAMHASKWGMKFEEPKIDIKKVASWKEKVVKKLTEGLGQLSKARNIEYIQGKAKFTGENELEVTDNKGKTSGLSFEKVIIATGSSAVGLPELEIDHEKIWDATDALELKEIPKKMLVVGGGYIGLELGSVYAALGTKVSIAEMTSGFLPGTDRDLVKIFEKNEPFKNVFFETKVEKVKITKKGVKVSLKGKKEEQSKKYDCVLVAVGRKPNTQNLGLKELGVSANEKGFLEVDDKRRTKLEHVFAIGDITGEPMLAHKASHEGRIAAEVIAGKKGAAYDPKVIPAIVFTNPELAWCGLTEEEAKEKEKNVKVVKISLVSFGKSCCYWGKYGLD